MQPTSDISDLAHEFLYIGFSHLLTVKHSGHAIGIDCTICIPQNCEKEIRNLLFVSVDDLQLQVNQKDPHHSNECLGPGRGNKKREKTHPNRKKKTKREPV